MNTNEFVDAVATEARLTKTQAREVIDAVFTAVTKGLVAGEKSMFLDLALLKLKTNLLAWV